MDLTKFNPKITAEAGYTFNVELPNGTITDIEITVRGEDSPAVRAHSRKMFDEYRNREALARRQKREVPDLTLDELEDQAVEMAIVRTKGWKNIQVAGKDVDFSEANAVAIYKEHSFIREQVIQEAGNNLNFKSK